MDFQRTTLIEVDRIMREHYPHSMTMYDEKRDENRKIIETLRTTMNETHQLEVKNVFDDWLWYREVSLCGEEDSPFLNKEQADMYVTRIQSELPCDGHIAQAISIASPFYQIEAGYPGWLPTTLHHAQECEAYIRHRKAEQGA